jgi:hypothetical protein
MKQVLIKPLWPVGLNGRLFDAIAPHILIPWREKAATLGIALDGWDTMPLDKADCVWLMDLPDTKAEFYAARRRVRPGVPFVLQIMEAPVFRPHNHVPANQALCDYVVTYQQNMERKNYFSYRIPTYVFSTDNHVPFEQRHCAVMVNINRVEGFLAPRQKGITGLPGIGRQFSGWKLPAWSWFQPARGELYSWRRKLARAADKLNSHSLNVVGPGWSGENISWCRWWPNRPYKCCIAKRTTELFNTLAGYRFSISAENYRGSYDWITERLVNALVAGTVPVYIGDENITKLVPSRAFVDVRHFKTHRELLLYLSNCPKHEWAEMYQAGQAFLKTEAARNFGKEAFIQTMNSVLLQVLGLAEKDSRAGRSEATTAPI